MKLVGYEPPVTKGAGTLGKEKDMGGSPVRAVKKAVKKVTKPVKKVVKAVDKAIVEPVESVTKKVAAETFDVVTGMEKEERRAFLGEAPVTPEVTPEITPEVTPEVVPDDSIMGRGTRRTKGKRAGQAGTIIEGYGSLYRGGSEKAVGN